MLRKGIIAYVRALVAAFLLALAMPVAAELPPAAHPIVTPTLPAPAAGTTDPSKRGFSIDPNG